VSLLCQYDYPRRQTQMPLINYYYYYYIHCLLFLTSPIWFIGNSLINLSKIENHTCGCTCTCFQFHVIQAIGQKIQSCMSSFWDLLTYRNELLSTSCMCILGFIHVYRSHFQIFVFNCFEVNIVWFFRVQMSISYTLLTPSVVVFSIVNTRFKGDVN
jgi:hypothetical protein